MEILGLIVNFQNGNKSTNVDWNEAALNTSFPRRCPAAACFMGEKRTPEAAARCCRRVEPLRATRRMKATDLVHNDLSQRYSESCGSE